MSRSAKLIPAPAREIDAPGARWHFGSMSTITISVPDPLEAKLTERMNAVGAQSREQYVLGLVEADCAAEELERVLADRWGGPFAPLAADWKDRVRQAATRA